MRKILTARAPGVPGITAVAALPGAAASRSGAKEAASLAASTLIKRHSITFPRTTKQR